MKKITLITGGRSSGKTSLAKEICKCYGEFPEVVWFTYEGKYMLDDQLLFSRCTDKTKLIIIDEFYDINMAIKLDKLIANANGITVNKWGISPFTITPEVIVILNDGKNTSSVDRSNYKFDYIKFLAAKFHEIVAEKQKGEKIGWYVIL